MSSRSGFKFHTAGPAAERPVRSLDVDREVGLYPFVQRTDGVVRRHVGGYRWLVLICAV